MNEERIDKQLELLKQELNIVLQKSKIKELRARSTTLLDRAKLEDFKLSQMERMLDETKNKD